MPQATLTTARPSPVELEYDTFGSPEQPALLLVMGFSAQMTAWDEGFCQMLADGGRFVIRFDNRDCGLSTKFDGYDVDVPAVLKASQSGEEMPPVPYTLSDFASDAVGLLDALGIERAHIAGASMGGMIAQTIAIEHPERVLSLTSIMSTTGDSDVGQAAPEAIGTLLTPPPTEREAYVEHSVKTLIWQSQRYGDAERAKARAAAAFDRSFYPAGAPRQLAAIYASGPRTEGLRTLAVPTLVVHGRDDTLIAPSGGAATAEAIPGAHYLLVSDMGHDLPEPLWPLVASAMLGLGTTAGVEARA